VAQAPPHADDHPHDSGSKLVLGVFVALKKGADRDRRCSRRRAAGFGVRAAAGPLCQARATPPPLAAAGCSVACSVAPRPGSALPCPGPQATSP
jgi:hypothetical protein